MSKTTKLALVKEPLPDQTERGVASVSDKSDESVSARERAEETALLSSLKGNCDSEVFEQLFNRFAAKLKSYLISLGARPESAEGVVQEVMVTVWTKSHLFDANKASARTWIFTLVRNRFIDFKRAEARQAKLQEQYSQSGIETETSADTQFNHAAGQQIALLMDQLPKEQAEILLMAYVEGKSHREISDELGVPIGTTKSRVRLAFQRLRKLMEISQ